MKNLILTIWYGSRRGSSQDYSYAELIQWLQIHPLKWFFAVVEQRAQTLNQGQKSIQVWALHDVADAGGIDGNNTQSVQIRGKQCIEKSFLCFTLSYVKSFKTEAFDIYGDAPYDYKKETAARAALKYQALCKTGYFD